MVKRRDFLAGFLVGAGFGLGNAWLWSKSQNNSGNNIGNNKGAVAYEDGILTDSPGHPVSAHLEPDLVHVDPIKDAESLPADVSLEDKARFFESEFADDIFLFNDERKLLHSVLLRMERVQRTVGHGNFNLISFDQMLKVARNYSEVGEFTPVELDFLEKLFFTDASQYGFLGDKVVSDLTARFDTSDVIKIPHSGHFLYKGSSLAHYEKLKKAVGSTVILTSGIRSNVKQIHLFLTKTINSGYNLSKASRSLAPPGHSYHGIGDYDIGKVGFGASNFTDAFSHTDEFRRMQDLGYIEIRYTRDNRLGVRFEPWHIKVV